MVFNYDLLRSAWKKTVVQSSTEHNRAKFKYYLHINLFLLLDALENNAYMPSNQRIRTVMFPKKRIVQVPSIRDKIVQHAICDNYLAEVLTRPLIKETSACIKGRGTRYATKVLKEQLHRYYRKYGKDFYVLKCDIKSYFASVPHGRLIQLIDRYVKDEDVNELVKRFVNVMPNETGLALGLQQSQLLANLYLSDLDHKCKELLRVEFYGRYMDDFYIISHDMEFLEKIYDYISKYVESIGLRLNPKTKISKNRIDYLGFTFYLAESGKVIQRLEKSKRRSKHRHLNKMLRQLECGEIDIDRFIVSYKGWVAHALQGNCKMLVSKYDDWLGSELKRLGYVEKGKTYVKND